MSIESGKGRRCRVLLLLWAITGCIHAHAGIPEPGIFLYGKVYGSNNSLITSGELVWTFTPASGTPVVVRTNLRSIDAQGGPYSYSVQIPLETVSQGTTASENVIPITGTAVMYTRVGTVTNTLLTNSRAVSISAASRGTVERVDFCESGNCGPGGQYHSADYDQNNVFSLSELLRIVQLYSEAAGAYHCDPLNVEDGFNPGVGDHECTSHSGDWQDPEWQFNLSELLRMIDLFNSTPTHAYCIDPTNLEDGFRAGACGSKDVTASAKAGGASSKQTVMRMRRTINADPASSGLAVLVTVHIEVYGPKRITAFGLQDELPDGWAFDAVVGGANPLVAPDYGATGVVDFAWLPNGVFPTSFTYRALLADPSLENAEPYGIGLYRFVDGPGERETIVAANSVNGKRDIDGDGIPDDQEGGGKDQNPMDVDGDGSPDHLDNDQLIIPTSDAPLPLHWPVLIPVVVVLGALTVGRALRRRAAN